jgi:hypothetical protein
MLIIAWIFAIAIGWELGGKEIRKVRNNPRLGVKPSNSLFTFLFLD